MKKTTIAVLALGAACSLLPSMLSAQTATFSKYVSLGDSLTAGFEGLCLVERNQLNSYPAVIAHQIGISDFEQPLVGELALTDPLVSNPCLGAVFVPPSTVTAGPISQQGAPLNLFLPRPYDNLGIVGAASFHLVDLRVSDPEGDTANKFGALVLRNSAGAPFEGLSAVDEANMLSPNLVSLWIGSNDISGAFLDGVLIDGINTTPLAFFQAKYQEVIDGLVASGRTLVVANVPDFAKAPFAVTIPPVVFDPATLQPVLVDGQTTPLLGPGDPAFPCPPPDVPGAGCSLPAGTLVTLGAAPLLAEGIGIPIQFGGTGQPLPHGSFTPPATVNAGVVIYPDEVAVAEARIAALNEFIASSVSAAGGVLVDIHALLDQIAAQGYSVGGITLTRDFLKGGIFSADGFHLSNIGYMIAADTFIQALNANGAAIPRPNFSTVLFTPNVPATTRAGTGPASVFTLSMWRELIASAAPAPDVQIRMPDFRKPEPDRQGGRTTRVVSRNVPD